MHVELRLTTEQRQEALDGVAALNLLGASSPIRSTEGVSGRLAWLLDLAQSDLKLAATVHFLVSDEVERALDAAERLASRLTTDAEEEEGITRAPFHGRIYWPATIRLQAVDPGVFWIRRQETTGDRPENRCLKFLVVRVAALGSEADANPAAAATGWRDLVRERTRRAVSISNVRGLDDVPLPSQLSNNMLQAAHFSRVHGYRAIGAAATLYKHLFDTGGRRWSAVVELLGQFALLPDLEERLFELVLLSRTDVAIRRLGFVRTSARLIGGGDGTAFQYRRGDGRITVYYRCIDADLASQSEYARIAKAHQVAAGLHQPDIFMQMSNGTHVSHLMVEVKFSDRPATIRDAIYQLFGYHLDFGLPLVGTPSARAIVASALRSHLAPADETSILLVHADDYVDVLQRRLEDLLADVVPEGS